MVKRHISGMKDVKKSEKQSPFAKKTWTGTFLKFDFESKIGFDNATKCYVKLYAIF